MVRVVSLAIDGVVACREEHAHEWYTSGEATEETRTRLDLEWEEYEELKPTRIEIGTQAATKGL